MIYKSVFCRYHTLKEALALDELRQLAGSNVSAMVMDDQFRISISLKDSVRSVTGKIMFIFYWIVCWTLMSCI